LRKNKYGKEIELLAPAGSYEKAIIAFKYGADAIYIGTPKISLRTKAKIEQEDLEKVVTYAHSHGKKVYAAINIYADDDQYEDIIEQCKMLEKLKVDGIIAADGGIIETIKEYAPSIPINISTQANTISLPACKFWKNNGAKRVILGREINIENRLKLMPFPLSAIDNKNLKDTWEKYRKEMISQCGIAIYIFGNKKKNGKILNADGVEKEYAIAESYEIVNIPLAFTGYMAEELYFKNSDKINSVIGKEKTKYITEFFDGDTNVEEIIKIINKLNNKEEIN